MTEDPLGRKESHQRISATTQLGPGRDPYSKRARSQMALVVGAVVVALIVLGVVLASNNKAAPVKVVTIPAADRKASRALLLAAEAVRFKSNAPSDAGRIETSPITTTPSAAANLLPVGSKAPDFTLRTPTGDKVSLASLRGKTVLLEAFATWCPHCAAEAPHLKAMYASLPQKRFAFVGVNADGEDAASILAYHIYFGLPFPALLDPSSDPGTFHHEGSRGPVSRAYKVGEFPTFYVIDPKGRVAWTAQGEQPDALLLRELRAASAQQ
jgi:peroxiredoxin